MADIDLGFKQGCSNLHLEKILVDTVDAFVTDTPIDLSNRVQGIKASFNNLEEKVNADDGVRATLRATPDAKITINITNLTPKERALILGNTSVGAIRGGGDTSSVPYYLVKYQENCSGGTNYVVFLKVSFAPSEKSAETAKSDSLTPQYETFEGTAMVRNYKPASDPSQKNLFYEVSTKDPDYNSEGATWYNQGDPLATADLVAPTISSSVPTADATGILATADYVWNFDKGISPGCVANANFFLVKDSDGSAVAGALTQDANYDTITFNPTSSLTAGAVYRAVATTNVKSLTGIALAANSVRKFTVAS